VKYLLLIAGSERNLNITDRPEPEATERSQAWATYTNELVAADKIRGGERLKPVATATTVRFTNGQRLLPHRRE
jgi:hypothetical protein